MTLRMSAFIILVLGTFISTSCNSSEEVDLELVNGYFIRNDVPFTSEVQCIILKDATEFEKFFGVAKTMNNQITEVDFKDHYLAAILLRPSLRVRNIKITNSLINDQELRINYTVNVKGKQTFKSTDLKIVEIPKDLESVNFVSKKGEKQIKIQ